MNAQSLSLLMLNNSTVVIDINGEVRQLLPGEVPGPGEVIVIVGQGATASAEPDIQAQLVGDDGSNLGLDLDNEIASIISQIEEGVDPTQNDDFATAAGGQNGSSLTGSGDIDRTGAETIAETEFETGGLESQGLSETQSLTLLEVLAQAIFVGDDAVTVFETDVPWTITGTVEATETDTPTFVVQEGVAGDNGVFSIDAGGNWTYVANSAFDELNIGDSLVDVFTIESADGTLGSVTVTINGTNDLPQFVGTNDFVPDGGDSEEQVSTFAFEDGAYSFEFEENSPAGTVVGQVAATDPDNDVLIFSISTNVENEGGEPLFDIDPETGEISLTTAGAESYANDFETLNNVHNLVVTVTEGDGIGEPQSVDVDVVLSETNVNEPPIFEPPEDEEVGYVFTYPENSEVGAEVGSVPANDPEETTVTYSLDFTNDPTLDGLFSIDPDGTIRLTEAGAETFTNDFEWGDDNSHSITVIATDATGLSSQIDVVLNEENVNEPPIFEPPADEEVGYVFTYPENSEVGAEVGSVPANDPEETTVTYSLDFTNDPTLDGLFSIDPDGTIRLTEAGAETFTNDFEWGDDNSHSITVIATDATGLSSQIDVVLNEENVNEPPIFEPPEDEEVGYVFTYPENSEVGAEVGSVPANDPEETTVTYSLDFTNDPTLDGLFSIDPDGTIRLTEAGAETFTNDFEWGDDNTHSITVIATDATGLSSQIDVVLNEENVNEPPIFEPPADEEVGYVFTYPENSEVGAEVGSVPANDPEETTVTYSLDFTNDPTLDGLFSIDPDGTIRLTEAGAETFTNDFEWGDDNSHSITVIATDATGLSSQIDVVLNEQNVNEPPIFEPPEDEEVGYVFTYPENSEVGAEVGSVPANDPEETTVTYSLDFTNDPTLDGLFSIDSDGTIRLTEAGAATFTNDFEWGDDNSHSITVIATDATGLSSQIDVVLNEQNVNEPPIFEPPEEEEVGYVFTYPENSEVGAEVGSVPANDPEETTVTYSLDFTNDPTLDGLFSIDPDGTIRLTEAGAETFTNDFEWGDDNSHSITVVATDATGLSSQIDVVLNEENVNEPPIFEPPEDEEVGYVFTYPENSEVGAEVGSVPANDPEETTVTYSLDFTNDPTLDGLFSIDPDGTIRLTEAGAETFTNDFEWGDDNSHSITVIATDATGLSSQIDVVLNEQDVNEAPVTEDFNVDAGDAIIVPIIFDSDVEELDHISDQDDDFNGIQLNVMITSLPQYGTLLYTDDFGDTRVITESDLHVLGEEIDANKLFDPDNFTYVPGVGDEFEMGYSGDPEDIVLGEDGFYNWGVYVSDTEREITLENGNTITVSIEDNNDKPLKQYTGGQPHVGWGIGDTDGRGMNKQETLIVNLANNPLGLVTFGLDGMGGAFNTNSNVYVEVTYTLADGTTHVEQYQKDEGDVGNSQILYEFSYSSPDNPIVSMELSSSGGSWELRYLSGTEDITEDVTFDYVAVDSELVVSNESTVTIDVDESPEYEVLSAELGDDLNADLGNQMMLGDENANIFTWLDSTIDNGTDVVDNFSLDDLDKIDLTGILEDDVSVDIDDLAAIVNSGVDGDDVVLTVTDEGREQTIILEGVRESFEDAGFIAAGSITNELDMLTQVLKTDAV
ncbi:cadherin repeat domain-containing protein [Vibrio aquaticus]|uniref:Cadherin repeat domain-containing protein n=1 Tax=Vibrio aquaticus TaxID=2496559 RepID=A0A3S0PQ21_9VIBR|nr:cadherin domain-containing protein [Vibrio aquaticus]RTZ16744.1 cadherin repeat domain-containing protein [Vibrio aquaticus]